MKIIEIIVADLFEGISKDELIKNLQQKKQSRYLAMVLKKMHELVQSQGERQSVGGSAFEISKYLGGAISGRELEKMYRKEYMNESQVNEWGRIVKGVNTTVDIGTDEIKTQAAKFGNTVDKDGFPPRMTTTAKSKSTTVKHHTPIKEAPRYTAAEWAIIEGGHTLEETVVEPKKPGKIFTALSEALDQPYPVRWSVKNDNEWYAHAKEDDFYNQMGIEIKDRNNSGHWSIRFKVGDKMDKTGEGDQFKIFATVKAAIQEWWNWASKNAQVDQITFSAEKIVDSSRSKLYNRFAQQFARTIGYEFEVVSGRATDIFYLKKPSVEENFADNKKPGRKGLAKRSGVNTKASASSLRKTAKNSSGEKQRMAHWLANMKSGKAKKK